MTSGVTYSTILFLMAVYWRQVSGESEFLAKRWVTSKLVFGRSAELSEDGYQQVASLSSDEQMKDFIARVLRTDGLEADPLYLQGFVPWYSGAISVQSLARLRKELFEKPWVHQISQANSTTASDGANASGIVSANISKVLGVANSTSTSSLLVIASDVSENLTEIRRAASTRSESANHTIDHFDPSVSVTTAAHVKPAAAGPSVLQAEKPAARGPAVAFNTTASAVVKTNLGSVSTEGPSAGGPNTASSAAASTAIRPAVGTVVLADVEPNSASPSMPLTALSVANAPSNVASAKIAKASFFADKSQSSNASKRSHLSDLRGQSQLAGKTHGARALSWLAHSSQYSANKLALMLSSQLQKPVLVMKDLYKLPAEDRARVLTSFENESFVFQDLKGEVKVLRGSFIGRLINVTEDLKHKRSRELGRMLQSKGAKCRNCTFQEKLDRVIATWDWPEVSESTRVTTKEREKHIISLDNVQHYTISRTCKPKCYEGKHYINASWKNQKCSWKICDGCPECGGELHPQAVPSLAKPIGAAPQTKAVPKVVHALAKTSGAAPEPNAVPKNAPSPANSSGAVLEMRAVPNAVHLLATARGVASKMPHVATKAMGKHTMSQNNVRDRVASGHCQRKCYAGKHYANASWKTQKCSWRSCDGCPECGGELHVEETHVKIEDHKEGAISRVCLPSCYKLASYTAQAWKEQTCLYQDCSGCPECGAKVRGHEPVTSKGSELHYGVPHVKVADTEKVTSSAAFSSCKARCYTGDHADLPWKKGQQGKCMWKHCHGCPECAGKLDDVSDDSHGHGHGHGKRPRKIRDVAKSKQVFTVPAADNTADHPINDAFGNAKTIARGVVQAAQGALKAASSMFSNFFGLSRKAGQTADIEFAKHAIPIFLASHDKQELDRKPVIQLADNQIESTKYNSEFLEHTKTVSLTTDGHVSPHAIMMAKATETTERPPSLEADFMVVPKAEGTTNAEMSAGSTQDPKISNVAKALPSFSTKAAAAVGADNSPTLRELDEDSWDTTHSPDNKLLPDVPSLVDKSKHLLQALNKQVLTLKEHLAEAEYENQELLANRTIEYGRILDEQLRNTTSIMNANEQLSREVQKLVEQNSELWNRAKHLKAKGARLHKHMFDLKANITLAQEYLDGILQIVSSNETALRVLRELDEHEAALAKSREHAFALQQVGSVSMLQTSSRTESSNVLEVVRNLKEKIDNLDREEAAGIVALKRGFEEQYGKKVREQNALKERGDQLTKDRDAQLALRGKLQAAVNHLEHAVSLLEQQIQRLQAYAERLAS